MPRVDSMYPDEWLKAKHLADGDVTYTIKADGETIFRDQKTGEQRHQIVLHFLKTDLKLGLNKGNANTLVEVFDSPDSEDWIGRKVVLGCATSNAGVDYVQVREKPTKAANRAKRPAPPPQPAARKPAPVMTQEEVDADQDIPFEGDGDAWAPGRE